MFLGIQRNASGLLCLLTLAALPVCAQKSEYTAKVTSVQEGDILKVQSQTGTQKIRLWGIDAPEMSQAFGPQAKNFTSDLVLGKTVKVKVLGTDNFKRQTAFLILEDGRNVNHEIVKAGMAWWFVRYGKEDPEIEKLEGEARKAKRGLWSDAAPTPPWEHRKHQRGPQ